MTGRGIALAVTLALLLLAALGTGVRELYFAVFLLGLLLLYAAVSALLAAACLRCRQSLDAVRVVRGETAGLRVSLSGFLLLPAVMRLHVAAPGMQGLPSPSYQFTLRPGRSRPALVMRPDCPHRGIWRAGADKARVYDLFGLFCLPLLAKGALGEQEAVLTVYPQIYELDGEPALSALLPDDSASNAMTADHGEGFAGTRAYRDGDSLKRIHWKQSIRTRELYTRQYEVTTLPRNRILLDTGAPAGSDVAGYADMACECAGTLCLSYLTANQPVELAGAGPFDALLRAEGPEDFDAACTFLAELPFAPADEPLDGDSLLEESAGALRSLHVITHRPTQNLLDALRSVAERRCLVSCLCPDFPEARWLLNGCPAEVRLVLVSRPSDILTELGDSL